MKQYNDYVKSANTKCFREFRMSVDELLAIPESERTEEQSTFLMYYLRKLPVGINDCVMNRICRKIEAEFDHKSAEWRDVPFDYTIMKTCVEYQQSHFFRIKKRYEAYMELLRSATKTLKLTSRNERATAIDDATLTMYDFRKACLEICSDYNALIDIMIDICYKRSGTKQFVWDICGYEIPSVLARRHDGIAHYPTLDADGDIEFSGMRFSMRDVDLNKYINGSEDYERDHTEREELGEECD